MKIKNMNIGWKNDGSVYWQAGGLLLARQRAYAERGAVLLISWIILLGETCFGNGNGKK